MFKTIKGITIQGKNVEKLSTQEVRAIKKLKRLVTEWPETLWLYSASGTLCVMQKKDGELVFRGLATDPDYCICDIDIENDGGDW